jgi:hypothetical protein
LAAQVTRSGLNSADPSGVSVSVTGSQVLDASFPPSQEVANAAAQMGMFMVSSVETSAFKKAQEKWQDNYCVKIQGVDENQYVEVGSETPFTASVRQEWEGKDLNVPVIATLTEGRGTVTPAGTKVTAPATFRYKAPDESSFHPDVVELVSRSRRGIAKLNVSFHIQDKYYRVDQVVNTGGTLHATGTVCALDKPFKLEIEGANAGRGPYQGNFAFTPAGTSGGSWVHKGTTTCLDNLGCGTVEANGTYQTGTGRDGRIIVTMNATTQRASVAGYSGEIAMPGWEFEMVPATGICGTE